MVGGIARSPRDEFERNLIVLADFNIDRLGDPNWQAFISTGLSAPQELNDVPRTIKKTTGPQAFYDQIAWFTDRDGGRRVGHRCLRSTSSPGRADVPEARRPTRRLLTVWRRRREQVHVHPAPRRSGAWRRRWFARTPLICGTIRFMGRTQTTVVLDDEVLARLRRVADRAGLDDSTVIESALRRYLSLDVVERVWERNATDPLDPARAEELAYAELRAARHR